MGIPEMLEMDDFASTLLNAMPLPIFIVDEDVSVFAFNQSASQMLSKKCRMVLRGRVGELLHCVHAEETPQGCGRSPSCNDCIVRNCVVASLRDHKTVRWKARMEVMEEGKGGKEVFMLVTAVPVAHAGKEFALLILQDLGELLELKSILPICSHCKKIRDDDQYWHRVEEYFKNHMDLDFSHSICPECARELYPDFVEKTRAKREGY